VPEESKPKAVSTKPAATKPITYADAGVDISRGDRAKDRIKYLAQKTFTRNVLGGIGGFGALYRLDLQKFKSPILVSSADGVGTKLKIAFEMGLHSSVGADLVNHCVNDIAVQGATPLFFLDYFASGKLDPEVTETVVSGLAEACKANGCALIGGETAQMPGFYQPGEYDVSGTIVGVVEKSRMLDGKGIRAGDVVLGLASSGLHTNGYSLARKIFFDEMKLKPKSRLGGLEGSIGDEMLKVHLSYGPLVLNLLKKFNPVATGKGDSANAIKGLAHITGGGFVDNIPRVLPKNCDVVIRKGSWDVLPIFQIIQANGGVPEAELYQVFNMGIGMTVIVSAEKEAAALKFIRAHGHVAWTIGGVVKGTGICQVV